ncbi:MAG: helix-turn-helix domain-containing protein [Methanoregula sp.]
MNNSPNTPVQKLGHLPPSAKLVYAIIRANRQMTQKEIIRESYLPERTVRYALSRLKAENVLAEYLSVADARQSLYRLAPAEQEPVPAL